MSEYSYRAIDPAGRERRGRVSAGSDGEARTQLVRRRLYVVSIDPASDRGAPKASLLQRGGALSHRQLALFTRQLATLAQVCPLEEALRTAARQNDAVRARGVIEAIHGGVVEGLPLSEAMRREPRSFPPLYRAMVSAGEGSGQLGDVLERLAKLLERQAELRAKVLAAVAYPAVLALVAMIVVILLMVSVVPRIVEQFSTMEQELPLLTRLVMGASRFAANWWWAVALAVAACGVLVWMALKRDDVRLRADRLLLSLPLFGRLIRDLNAARMARTLASMVASRLPLVEGLQLTRDTVGNRALRAANGQMIEVVRGGGSLSGAMRASGLFPPLLVSMTASGETAGRLDTMLERAADHLDREFDKFTATALALLEPAIIVIMGVVVALIILAILLPILQLQSLTGF